MMIAKVFVKSRTIGIFFRKVDLLESLTSASISAKNAANWSRTAVGWSLRCEVVDEGGREQRRAQLS